MQTIHARRLLSSQGWLKNQRVSLSETGRITQITDRSNAPSSSQSKNERKNASKNDRNVIEVDVLLPAAANLHSHSFQRAMSGLTEARGPDPSDSFWTWRKLMYHFLRNVTPEHIESIAALVFMEMLESGYASVAEFHYLHHDIGGQPYADVAETAKRIVTAAEDTGLGLTLLPVLYQHAGCDQRPLQGGQKRFGNTLDSFLDLHQQSAAVIQSSTADAAIGVAPHSLRAVDPASLQRLVKEIPKGPMHIHLAEQVAEVEEVMAHTGARPTQWLYDHHDVDQRWCLIHATQVNAEETALMAKSGAVVGLCPLTEANLGDGIFPAKDYVQQGGRFGVGSDSNVEISLFNELKAIEYSQRLRDRARATLATAEQSTGRVLFDQALRGGAQALGRDSGAIEVGQWADLMAINTDNEWLCSRQGDALLDSLIFTGYGKQTITDVWSAGRHVVKAGRHIGRTAIVKRFQQTLRELENASK